MSLPQPNDPDPNQTALIQVLGRVLQTGRNTAAYLEQWLRETGDAEIYAGISVQLADERRHLRLLSEQLRRLTRRVGSFEEAQTPPRPFLEAQGATDDLRRVCIIHHGVKAFVLDRLGHLVPLVDSELAGVLMGTARDIERHIRWADVRLARNRDPVERRQLALLAERIQHMQAVAWSKDWARISRDRYGLR